jgi:hypothetical protein
MTTGIDWTAAISTGRGLLDVLIFRDDCFQLFK